MKRKEHNLVLAVKPIVNGFGFAVFEGPKQLVDWGIKVARINKNITSLRKYRELLNFYKPDAVVIEDTETSSRRSQRVKSLIASFNGTARIRGIHVTMVPRDTVLSTFSSFNAITKYEMAKAIILWFPEVSLREPQYRKPWMSEDYGIGYFDAIALALTYFYVID